jgi:hypothetical protein
MSDIRSGVQDARSRINGILRYNPIVNLMQDHETQNTNDVHPFAPSEFPLARQRGTASRDEIRKTTHRVMGSRQSMKRPEHSNQPRQRRTGKIPPGPPQSENGEAE